MFKFNGKTYVIPGVYGLMKVIQMAGATIPDFNVGLLIAKSMKGISYNSGLKPSQMMLPYDDPASVGRDYGYDDLYEMFMQAKGQGAGTIFMLNAQPNTQASVDLLDVAKPSITVKAAEKNFGAFGNDIKLGITEATSDVIDANGGSGTATSATGTTLVDTGKTWTISELIGSWIEITGGTGIGQTRKISANTAIEVTVATWTLNPSTDSTYEIRQPKFTFSVTPTKNEKMITANVTTGQSYIYVNSYIGLASGMSINVMNNTDGKVGAYEIDFIDTVYDTTNSGYKVKLKTAIANANTTTALYARIMNEDTDNAIATDFIGSDWNIDNIVLTLNTTTAVRDQIICEIASGGDTVPEAFAAEYLGQIAGAVLGTSPAIGQVDYVNIAIYFKDWSEEFININKVAIRVICIASTDASTHATYKTLATTMRNDKSRPMHILVSAPMATAEADLITKAKALNSDEISLCFQDLNDTASYKTFLPQVFGIKLAKPVNHNLTRDLVNTGKLGNEWTDPQKGRLLKSGVFTCASHKTGYRILQGINTYQDHTHQWNEADEKTYLHYQRDIADYVHVGIMDEMDVQIGGDDITEDKLKAVVNAVKTVFEEESYIKEIKNISIKKVELGWQIKNSILINGLTDFIGITTYVLAGSGE